METKKLSRLNIAKRVGEAEKVASQVNWKDNDCLPVAVAFTHGLQPDYHQLGLHARATVKEAMEASKTLAERNSETTNTDLFVVEDRKQTLKKLKKDLEHADRAWLAFGTDTDSHVLGILNLGDDEFAVNDMNDEKPYRRMTSGELADHLMEYKKYTELGVCVVGFKKK